MRISDWSSDVCSSDLPLVEIHPDDGSRLGLTDGGLARVETPQGDSLYRVTFHAGQRPGELFVPIHWTDRTSSGGRPGFLPRPLVAPVSGPPGFTSRSEERRVGDEWVSTWKIRGETYQ